MKMSTKENQADDAEWSAEEEVQLFYAMDGLKPIGLNKHFYMACITERLSKSLNRIIQADTIWKHLRKLYNLDLLEVNEPLPFPNEQSDFQLPDTEYFNLMSRKQLGNTISDEVTRDRKFDIKEKTPIPVTKQHSASKDSEKRAPPKFPTEIAKRSTPKRTRGSTHLEAAISPSTTPPPNVSTKRRRL